MFTDRERVVMDANRGKQVEPHTLLGLKHAISRSWNRLTGDKAKMGRLLDGWRDRVVKLRDNGGATLKY